MGSSESDLKRNSFQKRLKDRQLKEALEFYVPLAQCSRSVSLEALNLEMVSTDADAVQVDVASASQVNRIRVRLRGSGDSHARDERYLHSLEPLTVRLVTGQESE